MTYSIIDDSTNFIKSYKYYINDGNFLQQNQIKVIYVRVDTDGNYIKIVIIISIKLQIFIIESG